MLNKSIASDNVELEIIPDLCICTNVSRLIIDEVFSSKFDDTYDDGSSWSISEEINLALLIFFIPFFDNLTQNVCKCLSYDKTQNYFSLLQSCCS